MAELKTALVTGASGFIGSSVIRALASQGIRPRALMRATSSKANLVGVDYEIALGDLSNPVSLEKAVAGVDYIFHLAGCVAARTPAEYFAHNSVGTRNLAKAARSAATLKRFVYVSSLAAGGPSFGENPRTEQDQDEPISSYGHSKRQGEVHLREEALGKYGITIVRPPAVYGPRDRGIFEFVKIVKSGVMPLFPSKTKTKQKYVSLIHVEDLVAGIVSAGLHPHQQEQEVFYLSGDGVHSWTEIFQIMADTLGRKTIRVPLPRPLLFGVASFYTGLGALTRKQFPLTLDKLKELEPDFWTCSNDKAKQLIGFQPRYDLNNGIRHTLEWYKQNSWL